jgi:hypothetical protein
VAQVHVVKLLNDAGEVHEHLLTPGEQCPACDRKIPQEKSDDATRPKRSRITITVPLGMEGVLEDLWIQVVEKYGEQWPANLNAARQGIGLAQVGERSWQWDVAHFCGAAVLMVPGLAPSEEG